jgi:hypothetical protein
MNRTTWKLFSSLTAVCAVLLLAGSASAASIAWISFHGSDVVPSAGAAGAGHTVAPDKPYTDLLTGAGHTVTRYVTADNFDTSVLAAHDVVVIGRSVNSGHYQQANETLAWNSLAKPTIIMSGYLVRNNRLGLLNGNATIPDTTGNVKLQASNTAHPIFTGIVFEGGGQTVLPSSGIVTFTDPDPDVVQRGISVLMHPPIAGGQVLATVGSSDGAADATVGGAMVSYFPAGAVTATPALDVLGHNRLIFLSGSREAAGVSSETAGMYDLTPTGAHLFLNAITFMQNSVIPEPATGGLAVVALAGLAGLRRKSAARLA